jgi:hypothetical protein
VGLPLSYRTASTVDDRRGRRLLFLGEDWSEKHDVELQDAAGRVLARANLPEAIAGMARLIFLAAMPAVTLRGTLHPSPVAPGGPKQCRWVPH